MECGTEVVFQGEGHIETFSSSSWAERGFCKKCGSHLFIKDTRSQEYGIPPGLFNDETGLNFNRQIFIDNKPEFYSFSERTQDIDSSFIYDHYPETREE
ncbi:MAG: GFA family protein [Pseudomonadota bacterium]